MPNLLQFPAQPRPLTQERLSIIRRLVEATAHVLEMAYADFAAGAEIEPGELTFNPSAHGVPPVDARAVRLSVVVAEIQKAV